MGSVRRIRRAALAACMAIALHGCTVQTASPPSSTASAVELATTPFFPQERYRCGPAALATVLVASGVDTSPARLAESVYLPARRGSLQIELIAATRGASRIPYPLEGSLDALAAELAAGRPVLVLQNLGVSWLPRWHYAVVVGLDRSSDRVILRSGRSERRVMPTGLFERTWRRGGHWALVTLVPGELPARPGAREYLEAVAAMESVGHRAAAAAGYEAAISAWPEDPLPLFGLGNVELAEGRFARAESLYRRALSFDANNPMVRNNLAYAVARQGRKAAAIDILDAALRTDGVDAAAMAALRDSRRELLGDGAPNAVH